MKTQTLPQFTLYDPVITSEGSIDPLGTYPIADDLANHLAPGVRERQRHPRFLTAIAVSLVVCGEYSEDRLAGDDKSPPWQVYEWLMVESLVKTLDDEQLLGLPGRDKATQAIRQGVHLNAARYLSVPSVFGFHGVYRRLAKELKIEEGGQLGETGALLVSTWEQEQGLDGFYGDTPDSSGGRYRRALSSAMQKSLETATAAVKSVSREFFSKHLAQYRGGEKELGVIHQALMSADVPLRREYLGFLNSRTGRSLAEKDEEGGELKLLTTLKKKCSCEMSELLEAILAYEQFVGIIEDRFYVFLRLADTGRSFHSPKEIAEGDPSVKQALYDLPELFDQTAEMLGKYGKRDEFSNKFERLREKISPAEWVTRLVRYHEDVQKQKPPSGKASWFERYSDGRLAARPAYRHLTKAIHGYRAKPLLSFSKDLRIQVNA